jgi:hypothetical protein
LDAIVRFALSPADATSVTDAVSEVYGRLPTAKDCRDVAGLVRRYSFNALEG